MSDWNEVKATVEVRLGVTSQPQTLGLVAWCHTVKGIFELIRVFNISKYCGYLRVVAYQNTMASDRPMSETTILRKHALYQTSYVEDRHVMSPRIGRSPSPARNPLFKKKRASCVPSKTKTSVQKDQSPPPLLTRTRLSLNQLDARRLQRLDRQRPWQEKPPKQKKKTKGTLRIFYDKTLPTDVDTSDLKFKARKYVSNSKYGDIYMIRYSFLSNNCC
ncbi:hypothetical protein DPMN_144847 [Dreissena polymorpha]|uniref:Uncharacterized protein n=1 Tax=Dreissena polymorpha TaxID=45954 RepID=A0A9D4F3W6_DREPO|nr:hypothetical protein DPMN_144847 [Dreissena polymorpha]